MHRALASLAALILAAAPALAQDSDPSSPDHSLLPGVTTTVTAGAWIPRLGGNSSLGGGTISVEDQLDLDDAEATLNLEVAFRKANGWQLQIGGFDFSTDTSGEFIGDGTFGSLHLTDGTPYWSGVDITSLSLDLSYDLGLTGTRPGDPAHLRIAPEFGLRFIDVKQRLSIIGGGSEREKAAWLSPYAGLGAELRFLTRGEVPLLDSFQIEVSGAIGPAIGGDGGYIWQVRGGVRAYFTPNIAGYLGYRLVELDTEDDDFEFDAGLQGLFIGASIRF
jgi:opacity protein-like surface antigen